MFTTFNTNPDYVCNAISLGICPNPKDYAQYLADIEAEIDDVDDDWDFDVEAVP